MRKQNYLFLLLGMISGSLLTWAVIEETYKQKTQKEIDTVLEAFKKDKENLIKQQKDISEINKDKPAFWKDTTKIDSSSIDVDALKNAVKQFGYSKLEVQKKENEDMDETKIKKFSDNRDPEYIEIISPNEFSEDEDNDRIELTYYADDILADDTDEPLEDSYEAIGTSWKEHIGDYDEEPDAVYVRNTKRQANFEILRDARSFTDVTGRAYDGTRDKD